MRGRIAGALCASGIGSAAWVSRASTVCTISARLTGADTVERSAGAEGLCATIGGAGWTGAGSIGGAGGTTVTGNTGATGAITPAATGTIPGTLGMTGATMGVVIGATVWAMGAVTLCTIW